MELLIAILLKLGVYYSPEQVLAQQNSSNPDQKILYARHIIENRLYRLDEDGGVIIEDDVDP